MKEEGMRDACGQEALLVRALEKSYDGVPVFKNVSLEFYAGGVYCLTAPSGAGKTTFLRILMGLETADGGRIEGSEKGSVAAVFQEDRLCPWLDAAGNIRLACPRLDWTVLRREMGCLLPEESLPKPVAQFSGGMRRRVSLLRALLSEGRLLLFDEPFKGLDEETRRQAIEYVKSRRNGRTLLFTTHYAEEAQALGAERIVWEPEALTWRPDRDDSDGILPPPDRSCQEGGATLLSRRCGRSHSGFDTGNG